MPLANRINGYSEKDSAPRTDERDRNENEAGRSAGVVVSLRGRLEHFTWAWFTATMSTGGLAVALAETPHRFRGLDTIGLTIFILNTTLFLLLCALMTTRLLLFPHRFKHSFHHPTESFFFGSFWLSIAVILCGTQLYGVSPTRPWLIPALRISYWIYATISLLNAIQQYWLFMRRAPAKPVPMNPAWFLPGYSAMLTGTVASIIAGSQPPEHRLPVIVSGCAFQGFGWLLSCIWIGMYVARLMESGLPPPDVRPGMFIPVGTAAYTIVALIGQARAIPPEHAYFAAHPGAAETLQTLALFVGVFLWLFSFWLFAVAVLACVAGIPEMGFTLSWWAFVFPNVGFAVATVEIGRELGSQGVLWVGSGMTVGLVVVWLFTAGACVRAVVKRRILWPGRDEDKDM
ncbi:voltage-dependent anion channel [Massariosphaeria phaeospora]|uniref:Voltage-dependent anion channel n=1 Tax=Massariosphaeria phaeospora TaxID=100035 RepID=A0A7C8M676_9PLEO|nr:voltage-dependent anion channel [Massariosphaeria phaeospora]